MVELKDFIRYAMSAYDNPHCITIAEFKQDVQKFNRLNKLLSKQDLSEVQVNTILNHILTLYNVFDAEKCTKMMFFKVDKTSWWRLKTFLVFINHMPDAIPEVGLITSDYPICQKIADTLRRI